MKDYLDGAEADLLKRGQFLLSKIPPRLPREFNLLTQKCRDLLTKELDGLYSLKSLSVGDRLRKFKRIVAQMDFLEGYGFAALNRATDEDQHLNLLIDKITQEINYPLLAPVVAPMSRENEYFFLIPPLNLLCVPLGESDSLLHLPDLYHELAHPFESQRYEPRVQPFRRGLARGLKVVTNYIANEMEVESRSRGPKSYMKYLATWLEAWHESWIIEFFCDLFATYTLGPAFAWGNVHLCAKRGSDPFVVPRFIPTTHPSDDARMLTILCGLRILGFTTEAGDVERHWQQLLQCAGYSPDAEYQRCYDPQVLERIAQIAYDAVSQMGCRIATPSTSDPIHLLLNQAWVRFWQDSRSYSKWETTAVQQLRSQLT